MTSPHTADNLKKAAPERRAESRKDKVELLMEKEYNLEELEEAKTALFSTLCKCEKIDTGKKLGKSQQTLLDRRIKALRLALALIDREIGSKGSTP